MGHLLAPSKDLSGLTALAAATVTVTPNDSASTSPTSSSMPADLAASGPISPMLARLRNEESQTSMRSILSGGSRGSTESDAQQSIFTATTGSATAGIASRPHHRPSIMSGISFDQVGGQRLLTSAVALPSSGGSVADSAAARSRRQSETAPRHGGPLESSAERTSTLRRNTMSSTKDLHAAQLLADGMDASSDLADSEDAEAARAERESLAAHVAAQAAGVEISSGSASPRSSETEDRSMPLETLALSSSRRAAVGGGVAVSAATTAGSSSMVLARRSFAGRSPSHAPTLLEGDVDTDDDSNSVAAESRTSSVPDRPLPPPAQLEQREPHLNSSRDSQTEVLQRMLESIKEEQHLPETAAREFLSDIPPLRVAAHMPPTFDQRSMPYHNNTAVGVPAAALVRPIPPPSGAVTSWVAPVPIVAAAPGTAAAMRGAYPLRTAPPTFYAGGAPDPYALPAADLMGADGVSGEHRVFVNGVPPQLAEAEIRAHFSSYGVVKDVYFPVYHTLVSTGVTVRGIPNSVPTKKRRGFCFVTMSSSEEVDRVVNFADRVIAGFHIPEIRRARPRQTAGGSALDEAPIAQPVTRTIFQGPVVTPTSVPRDPYAFHPSTLDAARAAMYPQYAAVRGSGGEIYPSSDASMMRASLAIDTSARVLPTQAPSAMSETHSNVSNDDLAAHASAIAMHALTLEEPLHRSTLSDSALAPPPASTHSLADLGGEDFGVLRQRDHDFSMASVDLDLMDSSLWMMH